jgi:hypothetical protein
VTEAIAQAESEVTDDNKDSGVSMAREISPIMAK